MCHLTGSDVALLRTAAQRLRQLADRATPGRWQVDGPWWHDQPKADDPWCTGMVSAEPGRRPVLLGVPGEDSPRGQANVTLAAVSRPDTARAVAGLLDLATERAAQQQPRPWVTAALDIAVAVCSTPGVSQP